MKDKYLKKIKYDITKQAHFSIRHVQGEGYILQPLLNGTLVYCGDSAGEVLQEFINHLLEENGRLRNCARDFDTVKALLSRK